MSKRVILGYDENGNPIYALPAHGNYVDPDRQPGKGNYVNPDFKPGKANIVNPDIQPAKWNKEMGRNIEVGKGNLGLQGAKTVQYGAATQRGGLKPFDATNEPEPISKGGNPSLLLDYSKDPYSTTVPGQPGYDASKDTFRGKAAEADAKKQAEDEAMRKFLDRVPSGIEWWQRSRGEKTGGSGLDAVHSDASEARRLQRQLDDERKWAESLYPGAGGRQHSTGGTNLGEPAWSGSGEGAAHFGTLEWECRSGTIVGENGVDLVAVLDQWNIYDGQ